MRITYKSLFIIFLLYFANSAYSQDTVKVMAYNLLNYGAAASDTAVRHPYFRTVLGAINPDIIVIEEILSQNAVNVFRDKVINLSGIGTFQAGQFIDGTDTDNEIYYRPTEFIFLSNTPIHTDLRDINEFKLIHIISGDTVRFYAIHLKANNTTPDQQARAAEVDSLRKVTNMLPSGTNFMVMGDFNIYSANEQAYIKLKQVITGNQGHFIDALNLPGTWNNPSYAQYHTQSTRIRAFGGGATGGMDDRFDMILYSQALNDPGGVTFIPGSIIAYGNDGNHYNDSINKPPNNAVPQNVADGLHYSSDHLPVTALLKFENVNAVNNQTEISSNYSLYQNYPNPFNPITIISYELRVTSIVVLNIYDISGKLVKNLVNKKQSAGKYEAAFSGDELPSGVYVYQLRAGNTSETKKMILLK